MPKRKRPRVAPTLKQREEERARKRAAEEEQIRESKFRLSKENNPYDGIGRGSEKPRRVPKVIPFPGTKIYVSKDTVYQYAETAKNFPWKKMTVTFLLILLGGIGSAMFQARNANIRTDIVGAERELRTVREENFVREAELRSRYTFDEIERIAIDYLGMSFPDTSQVVFINVPRIGGVTLNTAEYALPGRNYFREDVTNFITGIFNQIFGGD
jgi:hypothetical protein